MWLHNLNPYQSSTMSTITYQWKSAFYTEEYFFSERGLKGGAPTKILKRGGGQSQKGDLIIILGKRYLLKKRGPLLKWGDV